MLEPHDRLIVDASSEPEVHAFAARFCRFARLGDGKRFAPEGYTDEGLTAYRFVFDSTRVAARPELAKYAREFFPAGSPVLEAAFDLTHRIFRDFRFDTKATEVSTPVETFFEKRRVCVRTSRIGRLLVCVRWGCRRGM